MEISIDWINLLWSIIELEILSCTCSFVFITVQSHVHLHGLELRDTCFILWTKFALFLTNLSSFISVACDNVTGSLLISFLNWMYTWNQNVIDKEKCLNSKPKIFYFFSLLNKIIIMFKTYPKSYGSSNGNLISSLLKCSFKQSNASSHHSVNSFVWLIQSQTK